MSRENQLLGDYNPILSTAAQGYTNNEYVGRKLVKVTPGDIKGKYNKYTKEHFKKIPDEYWERALRTKPLEFDINPPAQETYVCTEKTLAGAVEQREVELAKKGKLINLLIEEVEQKQEIHELNKEIRIAEMLQDVSSYASGHTDTPSTKWDNTSEIDVILEDYFEQVEEAIGRRPNVALISGDVYNAAIKYNSKLYGKLGANERKKITPDNLKELLEVDEVVIGKGSYLSFEDNTLQKMWSNIVILAYVNPQSGREIPTFARLFQETGYPKVHKWFEKPVFHRFWNQDSFALAMTGKDAGFAVFNPIS